MIKNLAAPGELGSHENPLSVEQLEKMISKANGDAEVKVKGFREISSTEVATMNINTIKRKTNFKINDSLKQSLKDITRKPKKLFEDKERGLFLALDNDDKLWILEKSTWHHIKEPNYPDLPQKEIE